jgi:hypothetical protein
MYLLADLSTRPELNRYICYQSLKGTREKGKEREGTLLKGIRQPVFFDPQKNNAVIGCYQKCPAYYP